MSQTDIMLVAPPIQPQRQNQLTLQWEDQAITPQTNAELSQVLEIGSAKMLTWLGKSKSEHYNIFAIPKRDGTYRRIHNPQQILRVVQYKLLRNLLDHVRVPEYIFAFEKEKSIPKMALNHVNKRLVISVDIKDFFQSIKQTQIFTLLTNLGIGTRPARTISEICTYKSFVPQGALTSPKISNLIAACTFGPLIKEYCDARNYVLTIYADDITISSDDPATPIREIIQFLTETLLSYGYLVNRSKTKVMSRRTRQYVCGVVVNEKTNLKKFERQKLRAIVHNITQNGLEAEAAKNGMTTEKFSSFIQGKLNWYSQLNPNQGITLKAKFLNYLRSLNSFESNTET